MNDTRLPSKLLENAVNELSKLPGIGNRTALRLALHILEQQKQDAKRLGNSILQLVENVRFCNICHNITESDTCSICEDSSRTQNLVCVVEDIRDMMAIESTLRYRGVYHILGGIISPVNGVGPHDLTIDLLKKRIENGTIQELIFALPTTMEGDTTAYYLFRSLGESIERISTLARGIAFGDQLQYTDEITLGNSIADRVPYKN
ncbi:MAG: recombination mediator RecR [Salinivirgaceae bacterium]|nr:recombination mediator RecR [Salinivirgaceae bacterium]MDY0279484.1 recombination mediator RecR [Salinivirgaceae bacterium]